MKKVELSEVSSNLLVVSSVMVAIMPFLLGDRLVLLAGSALRELAIFFNETSTFVVKLLS